MNNIIIIASFVAFIGALIIYGIQAIKNKINMFGVPSINTGAYAIGKISIVICWIGILFQSFGINIAIVNVPIFLEWTGVFIFIIGILLLIISLVNLGLSTRVGIPNEKTKLKTTGLYKFTRNPMYVGVHLTCIAASVYTLNPGILFFTIIVIIIHHKIIIAEEEFLKKRFGKEWAEFSKKVRRYI